MKTILCGDIGGTNANLCIAEVSDRISLKNSLHKPTKEQKNFPKLIKEYLSEVEAEPTAACFAVAGPVKNGRVEMTNSQLVVDSRELKDETSIPNVFVINDFDAIGFAINVLEPEELLELNCGEELPFATRAAIGAGTGLGKNILIYDVESQAYLPIPSEGGHVDFPCQSVEELQLIEFVKRERALKGAVVLEELLSGRGLEIIYQFYKGKRVPAKEISKNRESDAAANEAFKQFIRFYGRAAKNFALETLAYGGIYIAGGIAASNQSAFQEGFMEEFTQHSNPKYRAILQRIPVRLIKNYDCSLKGAAFAGKLKGNFS